MLQGAQKIVVKAVQGVVKQLIELWGDWCARQRRSSVPPSYLSQFAEETPIPHLYTVIAYAICLSKCQLT